MKKTKNAIQTDFRYDLTSLPLPLLRPIYSETKKTKHGDAVLVNDGRGYLWSGAADVPGIGERVRVRMNGLGLGTVTGYLVEHGWLGVRVQLDNPPDWYRKQNGNKHAMVFGVELAETIADVS